VVLNAQADAARALPGLDRAAPRNDILWDDEPEQDDARLTSAPAPLGSGANLRPVAAPVAVTN